MASQALYRKWRSQTFGEIVSQEHVVQTLRNALRDGRIAHAYLFTGPRGTGKTSMARLLAKAVNCIGETDEKPCNQCPICESITQGRALDLVEIDAASNRGIDEVRDLREKVRFRPNECRYRVYILDEAHMLTTQAFNALLKTLEEPPDHAIFVLVTTEPQNIPITILSRCQRFDFRRIPLAEMVAHLRHVADDEGLDITEEALELVARQATGSMRDALSLLDQLMAFRQEAITVARIHEVLGTAPEVALGRLVQAVVAGDMAAGLRALNETLDQGAEPRQFAKDLLEYLRALLLLKIGGEAGLLNVTTETLAQMKGLAQGLSLPKLLGAIRAFNQAGNDLKGGIHPRLPLEMALVNAVLGERAREVAPAEAVAEAEPAEVATGDSGRQRARDAGKRLREKASRGGTVAEEQAPEAAAAASRDAQKGPKSEAAATAPRDARQEPEPEPAAVSHQEAAQTRPEPTGAAVAAAGEEQDLAWFQDRWESVLDGVRGRNRSVVALLNKSCEPVDVRDNVLTVGFYHDFHLQKMEQPRNLQVLQEVLGQVAGRPMGVKCVPFDGDRQQRAQQREAQSQRQEEENAVASDPIVEEAVNKYGARVTSVRPLEE